MTYTEKLQWLKLYGRRPLDTTLSDKYAVKDYISNTIGSKYVIPLLGVWDNFEDIDFDSLPSQFVMKCTHNSGGKIVCKDKSRTFDKKNAKRILERCLKRDFFYKSRECAYKGIPRRIIVEKYMEDSQTKDLKDYKFFCFDGIPKVLFIATERQASGSETRFDFFDMDFNHLDIKNGHPNAGIIPSKPGAFNEMKELASSLSKGIPHVRVDFYEVDGHVYFGEMTYSHWGGMTPFEPEQWDLTFGEWIKLPNK